MNNNSNNPRLFNDYCEVVWVPTSATSPDASPSGSSTPSLPVYKTKGAAGADICAFIDSHIDILPHQRAVIPTGWRVVIPEGWEMQVRPRSGLALRDGITVLNSPGTIDSDFRGEVQVILYNSSDRLFSVHDGDRIAQVVVKHKPDVQFVLGTADDLSVTDRGSGGFGSTGIK